MFKVASRQEGDQVIEEIYHTVERKQLPQWLSAAEVFDRITVEEVDASGQEQVLPEDRVQILITKVYEQ